MNLDDMIAVLEAAKRGEKIEVLKERFDPREAPDHTDVWKPIVGPVLFNMPMDRYRIAPKKEMTLAEEARRIVACVNICEGLDTELLEAGISAMKSTVWTRMATGRLRKQRDELLAELKRRASC